MNCPNCGYDNRAPGRFCARCGILLTYTNVLGPGSVLQNGRYRIEKILGQGGMGAALLARDTRLGNKLVVVKEMVVDNSDPAEQAEARKNFEREAVLLSNIGKHPAIPSVTDYFTEGTRNFLIMEYIDGENLEEMLNRLGHPLDEQEVLHYASEICDALNFLSQQTPPVVHRDIKPANIIVSRKNNQAHLVDFGIARETLTGQASATPKHSQALGTPGYCPPEQYQNRADSRSDLYALAATIHHVVTGRDPRNQAPFVFPPVRSLVPSLSPELERILAKELVTDPNQRYQSAAEIKADIDYLLTPKTVIRPTAAVAPSISTTPDSGDLPTRITALPSFPNQPGAWSSPGTPTYPAQPGSWNSPGTPSSPNPPPYQQPGSGFQSAQPQPLPFPPSRQRSGANGAIIGGGILAVVIALLIIGLILLLTRPSIIPNSRTSTPTPLSTPVVTATPPDMIGLSTGQTAFDTVAPRKDTELKKQAALALAAKDFAKAQDLLQQATTTDPSDAEAWIYQENLRIQQAGAKYVTIVIGTMITGIDRGAGRSNLQGAYIAQKEINSQGLLPNGLQVRVMIANSGDQASGAGALAQQLSASVRQGNPENIIAVMGWPFSSRTLLAYPAITGVDIPMVSQAASSVKLTNVSKYFFRVCPPDSEQGKQLSLYATSAKGLKARHIVVISDPADPYSKGLAVTFTEEIRKLGAEDVVQKNYTEKKSDSAYFISLVQESMSQNPDLFFFAGFGREAIYLAHAVAQASPTLQVLGGDGVYKPAIVGADSSPEGQFAKAHLSEMARLHFTSFAYPDEWAFLNAGSRQPAFFADYQNTFNDPTAPASYGSTRADYEAMLSFDAVRVIAQAITTTKKENPTPTEVRDALATLPVFQGVSGQIRFSSSGDPLGKALVILHVSDKGNVQLEQVIGKFFV